MGRSRAYTPSSDDVGYVLKFEVAIVDKLHPYAVDMTRSQSVLTARVRPTPNPPVRSMVHMVPPSQLTNSGRFTVLTYNLLADLYAKVGTHRHAPSASVGLAVVARCPSGKARYTPGQRLSPRPHPQADFSSTCPAWCLHWQYRKRNLLRELLTHKADILCLQEVQSDHYLDWWAPELQRAGYVAIYKKKTTEIYTDNKYAIDGCATFFRRDR